MSGGAQAPDDEHDTTGSQLLDRVMPVPVALSCIIATITGQDRPLTLLWSVCFIAGNVGLNPRPAARGLCPAAGRFGQTVAAGRCVPRCARARSGGQPRESDRDPGAAAQAGIHAELVESGRAAVERAVSTAYDLVLMDCHMPEMDGYAAVAELRAGAVRGRGRARLTVIALTADVGREARQRCLEAGMDHYLKPIDAEELDRALVTWLTAAQPRSA